MLSLSTGIQILMLLLLVDTIDSHSSGGNQNLTDEADKNEYNRGYKNIYGGIDTVFREFPFMAALGWPNENGDLEFRCGGMLITSSTVLTAAHCLYFHGKPTPPYLVHIGGDPLSESNMLERFHVANVTIYPEYRSNQGYHDIALVELKEFTNISPVCLWTNSTLLSNATAIGYGLTAFGETSEKLLKVNLTVFPETYCRPFYKRQRQFKNGLSYASICAGDMNGNKDTCQGDSGGPLIARYMDTDYAVGITSTGQACSGFPPAIYTKIPSYLNWIYKMVGYSRLKKCP